MKRAVAPPRSPYNRRYGYTIGGDVAPNEQPWPTFWEKDTLIDNGHYHHWERVWLQSDERLRPKGEFVVRCQVCLAPRCGHAFDDDPCIERRHHSSEHLHLSGKTEPIGGYADQEG